MTDREREHCDRNPSRRMPDRLPRGEANKLSKLTADAVREIRRRVACGELQRDLAREFGVGSSVISEVVTRKAWRHVA